MEVVVDETILNTLGSINLPCSTICNSISDPRLLTATTSADRGLLCQLLDNLHSRWIKILLSIGFGTDVMSKIKIISSIRLFSGELNIPLTVLLIRKLLNCH